MCAIFFSYSRRLSAIGAMGSSNISDVETYNAKQFEGKKMGDVSGKSYARVLKNSARIWAE
jgi:hypothetical protein